MNDQVLYFSRTGNSKRIAEKIASMLNTEVIEIRDHMNWRGVIGYIRAGFYSTVDKKVSITLSRALDEQKPYIVVAPLWAGGIAPAVRAFFRVYPKENAHLIVTSLGSTLKERAGYLSVTDIIQRAEHEDEQIKSFLNDIKK